MASFLFETGFLGIVLVAQELQVHQVGLELRGLPAL